MRTQSWGLMDKSMKINMEAVGSPNRTGMIVRGGHADVNEDQFEGIWVTEDWWY